MPAPALPRVDAEARPLRSRTILLGLLVGLPLSALFLYLAFRKADVAEVWRSITGANAAPLILAVVAMGVVYAFQADRWRWIAQGDHGLSRTHYAGLVVGGVACNNVLPGRLGDLLRAFWLRRDAPMPGGRALATVIVDRACDLVVLVLGLLIAAPLTTNARWVDRLELASVVGIAVLGVSLLLARSLGRRWTIRATSRVRRSAQDLLHGLSTRPSLASTARVLGLSVLAWTAWAVAAWLVGRSLGFHLSPLDAVFVTSVMNLGVAIPSSPGFVGTYQWLALASLTLVGVDREDALAFAILMQAVWFVPTTIVGGVVVVRRAVAGALVAR